MRRYFRESIWSVSEEKASYSFFLNGKDVLRKILDGLTSYMAFLDYLQPSINNIKGMIWDLKPNPKINKVCLRIYST